MGNRKKGMKKLKKSIVLILSLCIVLTACGSKEKEKPAAEENKATVTQEAPKETPKEKSDDASKEEKTKDSSKDAAKP